MFHCKMFFKYKAPDTGWAQIRSKSGLRYQIPFLYQSLQSQFPPFSSFFNNEIQGVFLRLTSKSLYFCLENRLHCGLCLPAAWPGFKMISTTYQSLWMAIGWRKRRKTNICADFVLEFAKSGPLIAASTWLSEVDLNPSKCVQRALMQLEGWHVLILSES